jgi:hypothetical protein
MLVLNDRLQASTTEAPFIRVADLVAQTMNMADSRCSIRAIGINFEAHYDLGSIEKRDEFAMKFAPPDARGKWGSTIRESMNPDNIELHGGLAVITMRELFRFGDIRGWYDVTLSSSDKVPNNSGIRFATNHHHDFVPELPFADDVSVEDRAKIQTDALLTAVTVSFDESINKG